MKCKKGWGEEEYLNENGDKKGRIKAEGICIGGFWGAISTSGDVRTRWRDPDIGETL